MGLGLRLVCAYCAFGITELAYVGIKHVVVRWVPRGDGSLPGLDAVVGLFGSRIGAGAWLGWLLGATLVLFCCEVALVIFALRSARRPGFPVAWVVFGGIGLLLQPVCVFLSYNLTAVVAQRGSETMAALVVANQVASSTAMGLRWMLWGGLLLYLAIRFGYGTKPTSYNPI